MKLYYEWGKLVLYLINIVTKKEEKKKSSIIFKNIEVRLTIVDM